MIIELHINNETSMADIDKALSMLGMTHMIKVAPSRFVATPLQKPVGVSGKPTLALVPHISQADVLPAASAGIRNDQPRPPVGR